MPSEYEPQLSKFDDIIAKISDDINSSKVNYTDIYEEIKNQLRKNVSTAYEEWKNSKFDPSFKFKLYDDCDDIIEKTLLHSAIDCREEAVCVPLVQCLLEKKADPNVRDSYNQTPLSSVLYAREDKNKQVVELLLGAGADQNAVDNDATYRRTPLSIACKGVREGFSIETIKLLLERGVNVNEVADNKGNIILHQLVEQSFRIPKKATTLQAQTSKLIKILTGYGANIYAQSNSRYTPEKLIANQLHGHTIYDKKFVTHIQEFLEKQKESVEYHHKLYEVVEQYQDLRSLIAIIKGNGLISIRGVQVCSKAVPQALEIPGIKLVIMVDGEIKQEFSQGIGYPVISVEVGSLRYYDLLGEIISVSGKSPGFENTLFSQSETLSYKISCHVRENIEVIKQELWSLPEITRAEDGVATQHVAREEFNKDNQDTTELNERIEANAADENETPLTEPIDERKSAEEDEQCKRYNTYEKATMARSSFDSNSDIFFYKEAKDPPKKQKIAITIGVVIALATALACYSNQLPVLAIATFTLLAGVGAYVVSSKLCDVFIHNGANQQPDF